MPCARLLRTLLLTALFCVPALPARALRLGETRAQLLAQHGNPGAEDHAQHLAMYFWEGWSAQVEFGGDAVRKITYRRNWYLQETEISSLLQANGGAARWQETSTTSSETRQWSRDDGACATCARVRPLGIEFQSGLVFANSSVKQEVSKPPASSAALGLPSTRKSIFPKPLAAELEPELPEADAPNPMPVPKLRVPELDPAVAPASGAEASPAAPPTPRASGGATPSARETSRTSASQSVSSKAAPPHTLAYSFVLVVLALGGIGFYLFKHRALPILAKRTAPGGNELRLTSRRPMPELSSLRWDQFELLIGEIFRRHGCIVELSAALGSGDGIDLTLRDGSETILVQCKHWKTAQVGEGELREFYGSMAGGGAPRGIIVTTGDFSAEARKFAENKGIELMDGLALAESIATSAKPGENLCTVSAWLDDFIAHARIFDPECPVCHGTMAIRHHRASGAPFWACRNHPRCPGRREPRLDLLPAANAP